MNDYYLGLDGGTDSLGWAVTTTDYKVMRKAGKSLWGVRLFDAGNTAAERRAARTARRRQGRKVLRLKLLKELFAEEVAKTDPSFFARLDESRYWKEDKKVDGADSLFHDKTYTDRQYHAQYPTIYHLRKAMMETTKKEDIRLLYLAVAHIIKNRGHFLLEGQSLDTAMSFPPLWAGLVATAENELQISLFCEDVEKLKKVLTDKTLGVSHRGKQLELLLGATSSQQKVLAQLLAGSTKKLSDLFDDESLKDMEFDKITFAGNQYEENQAQLEEQLDAERFSLLQKIYAVHSWAVFSDVLQGCGSISDAKIKVYEKHKQDLKLLKSVVKKQLPQKYNSIFRSASVKNNYCAYVGQTNRNGRPTSVKGCTAEDFYKFLKSELALLKDNQDETVKSLMAQIENGTLLPKQVTKDNGIIPYQVQLADLERILAAARPHYAFLSQTDASGYTVEEKIKKLLTFRIPYYVGPLNDAHREKNFCWVVKKADERILPWNFDKVVDEEASAQAFIKRMTSTCTYLVGEDVLPQNSLLYTRFMALNELNNLKIRGEKPPVQLKQQIFEDLFKSKKKVRQKDLLQYLNAKGFGVEKTDLSGIDGDFKASLAPYLDFLSILGANIPEQKVEDCLFQLAVFGDSRRMLNRRVTSILGSMADEKQVAQICSLRYRGWGRLSKKLLTEVYSADRSTGEAKNIIGMLYETNNNFMQLLSAEFDFKKAIDAYNNEQNGGQAEFSYDALVKDLYASPSVKRSIWQTLVVVKEVEKIMGAAPKKVFVEMARGGDPKQKNKRTISRKEKLLALYADCKKEERDWAAELGACPDDRLRSDKLFLYYCQMGRCMYSGDRIEIDALLRDTNNQLYDIDHIYPQSKVKDDSIDNRVLVKKQLNSQKSDHYPLPDSFRQGELWATLLQRGLISKVKYDRLARRTPFTDNELADFINRQLVETRQSTKAVAEALKHILPEKTAIVYVKAGLPADFRQEFELVKCRDVNDFHHAKDAYLNIVVGNVYDEKFTRDPLNFVRGKEKYSLNLKTLFHDWDLVKGGRMVWQRGEKGTLATVQAQMAKNDILFTRYANTVHGALFDLLPMPHGKGQMPLKGADPRFQNIKRYGGYNKVAGAYFALVQHTEKGVQVKSIESVPVYLAAEIEKDPAVLDRYFAQQGMENAKILLPKIKINALFKIDGFLMHLSGRTGDYLTFKNALQLRASEDQEHYIKKLSSYLRKCKAENKELKVVPEYDKITPEQNLALYDFYTEKLLHSLYAKKLAAQGTFLAKKREEFYALPVEKQVKQLAEILHFFQCNGLATDLTYLAGSKSAGLLTLSKKVSGKNLEFLYQSPTGFFTQKIELDAL